MRAMLRGSDPRRSILPGTRLRPLERSGWALAGVVLGVGLSLALHGSAGAASDRPHVRTVARSGARMVAGVGVGWPHTRQGAMDAAATYNTIEGRSWSLTDPSSRHAALAAVAGPGAAPQLFADADDAAAVIAANPLGRGLRTPGVATVLRQVSVGRRLAAYQDNRARVEVWTVSIVGNTTGLAVRSAWAITAVDLAWSGGDWKLVHLAVTPGPSPLADPVAPASAADLADADQSFDDQGVPVAR